MIGDFAKIDGGMGLDFNEVMATAERIAGEDNLSLYGDLAAYMREYAESIKVSELDGYYAGRITTDGRTYYPRKGTLKILPIGHVIFVDDMNSPDKDDGKPVYVTIRATDVSVIHWYPEEEAEEEAEVLPMAA